MVVAAVLAVAGVLTAATAARAATATVSKPAPATQPVAAAAHDAEVEVGWLTLKGELHDGPPPFAFLPDHDTHPSLRKIIAQLRYIAHNAASKGVVIFLDDPEFTAAQGQELAAAMREVRDAHKRVLIFAEEYDLHTYSLACAADTILLQHKGELELLGMDMEEMYLAGMLGKLHMKADFLQVGKYKGAAEPLTNTGPSPEWSQNIDALLDDLYGQAVTRIAEARHLDKAEVEKAFADCWEMSDADYVKRGLIDHLADRDLKDVTGAIFGDDFSWDTDMGQASIAVNMDNPFAFFKLLFQGGKPQITRPSLALVHAYGVIDSGDSSSRSPLGLGGLDEQSIGSRTMIHTLGDAADNDLIKGVVLRIDSPGGSALASEMIWQAIRNVAEKKPVYISVGEMAASGGYYMACAGQEIYADSNSIVGSIGVVGGKIVLGGLYDWIGVGVHRRARGPMADTFNSVEPFTPQQRQLLEKAFDRTYHQFLDRVQTGRGRRLANVGAVAEGRLFTGRQAVQNGLIDHLGGVDQALTDLAKRTGLEPGKYDVIDMPQPVSLPEYLDQVLGIDARAPLGAMSAQAEVLAAARQLVGPANFHQVQAILAGFTLLHHEHVLTLMPTAILVH
jgi:protease-4